MIMGVGSLRVGPGSPGEVSGEERSWECMVGFFFPFSFVGVSLVVWLVFVYLVGLVVGLTG